MQYGCVSQAVWMCFSPPGVIYTEMLRFLQLLGGSSWESPLFWFSLLCSEQVSEAATEVRHCEVEGLVLSDTLGGTAAGWSRCKIEGLSASKGCLGHMLELCAVVFSLTAKHDSWKLDCSNKSLIASVYSSEVLLFRNEWIAISIYCGLSILLSCICVILGLFGCIFVIEVPALKGWAWNHNWDLYFLFLFACNSPSAPRSKGE